MAIQRTPMTRTGHERLKAELERLKHTERPAISKAIGEARAHGDLSENAEYHAAREKQGMIEARINDLEGKLATVTYRCTPRTLRYLERAIERTQTAAIVSASPL